MGSCGTITALMLTTVSLMEHSETRQLSARFLFQLRLTVFSAIATTAFAVAALLMTTFPFALGADVRPPRWQIDSVYFFLLGLTALMVGRFAVVLSSLAATISQVLGNLPRTWMEEILTDDTPCRRTSRT